ncbi:hypothetical protein Y032_0041g449 [Ancylostoma ceylanicum]|uniref:Uncharacterized protein n=1 Tax=Ancylostoma ceylanicum TaxID=53326 RepID=A0A016UH92_9BILA|nr:hypothetical protein Y032_0041g449 [Ancylostoma ceylanicum]
MQNELLDPTISPGATPHVGQHVTVPAQPLSGPLSQTPTSSNAEPEQPDPNRARKVAEVFLTAGHAFQKLGDLAMQLHMGPSSIPAEERWSENNVDHLREALTRFAHELDQISNNVQARTTKMISTDIRRRHMMPQRPATSTISALKRQPAKLGPVIVPKRLNVTRNARQYMPARLSTAPTPISQVVVPTTKAFPLTRASGPFSDSFNGASIACHKPACFCAYSTFEHGLSSGPTHISTGDAGRSAATIGSTNVIGARSFDLNVKNA